MSRRPFTHLSQVEIRDIVSSFYNGEAKHSIAQRLQIDNSTVHYHIRKYERSFVEQSTVYAVVKSDFRKVCNHPSVKCSLCGKYHDTFRREEQQKICELETENERLRQQLERLTASME